LPLHKRRFFSRFIDYSNQKRVSFFRWLTEERNESSRVCGRVAGSSWCNGFGQRFTGRQRADSRCGFCFGGTAGDLANYYADYAGILAKHLGDRVTVWAPFNMPWSFTYMGYGVGAFPPGRANFSDFLKAAHTVTLAQAQALRAIKAVSAKATVGSAYGMCPAYPKTESESDHAAAARYHAPLPGRTHCSSSVLPAGEGTWKPSAVMQAQ
jgi:hypothetical protein